MTHEIRGRNTNQSGEARVETYELDLLVPVTIAVENEKRCTFHVSLDHDPADVTVIIRYYPAAKDVIFHGRPLGRRLAGNDASILLEMTMTPDNIYTGEISAMGVGFITVTEY